jgi:hypothetical protein
MAGEKVRVNCPFFQVQVVSQVTGELKLFTYITGRILTSDGDVEMRFLYPENGYELACGRARLLMGIAP